MLANVSSGSEWGSRKCTAARAGLPTTLISTWSAESPHSPWEKWNAKQSCSAFTTQARTFPEISTQHISHRETPKPSQAFDIKIRMTWMTAWRNDKRDHERNVMSESKQTPRYQIIVVWCHLRWCHLISPSCFKIVTSEPRLNRLLMNVLSSSRATTGKEHAPPWLTALSGVVCEDPCFQKFLPSLGGEFSESLCVLLAHTARRGPTSPHLLPLAPSSLRDLLKELYRCARWPCRWSDRFHRCISEGGLVPGLSLLLVETV